MSRRRGWLRPRAKEGIDLTPVRVIETPAVTHIRYRVDGTSALTLDERVGVPAGAEGT